MSETTIRLDPNQLRALAEQIAAGHLCRFDESERATMRAMTAALDNGGMKQFRAVLDLGEMVIQARKAGAVALITGLVGALLTVLWLGVKDALRRG